MANVTGRTRLVKSAFAAMVLAAGLFASPQLTRDAYAFAGGCTASGCSGAGSCSADPDPGETCYCKCDFWTGAPTCNCKQLRANVDG